MPSWNIHTGLVERLLSEEDPSSLGIRDVESYHFGNLVPDVYVGYMVPSVSHTLRYIDTHYGQKSHIPVPEADRFWCDWIEPAIPLGGVDDMVLGAWAHLLADNRYNARVRAFNEAHSIPSGEKTRIAKQGDFDLFGHGLSISRVVDPTRAVIEQAGRFPQYTIEAADVAKAVEADRAVVEAAGRPPERGDYVLLPRELIQEVFDQVHRDTVEGLRAYVAAVRAAGHDPLAPAPPNPGPRPDIPVGPEPAVLFSKDYQAAAAINDGAAAPKGPGDAPKGSGETPKGRAKGSGEILEG